MLKRFLGFGILCMCLILSNRAYAEDLRIGCINMRKVFYEYKKTKDFNERLEKEDEKVKKEIESTDFAHNYVSRYVSICLVDSGTGEVTFNSVDERIVKFVEFFKPQFDSEKVAKIKELIKKRLSLKDYVVYSDILEETKEPRTLVNKAFYDLTDEGKYRMRHIKLILITGMIN